MDISIVIPTYNRLHSLKRVLTGLENQTLPSSRFEVVVISDGATDGTNDFLSGWQTALNLRPVFQANAGVAAARNAGFQMATGDLIVFLDDDVVPAPQLLVQHVRIHAALGDQVIVLGPMLTPPGFAMSPWVQWEQAMLIKQYAAMSRGDWEPTARQFYTGNTSLRRSHLLVNGGFDTQFTRAEDVELAYRLAEHGLRFVFNADAVGYHYAERSFASWIGIPYAYGRNDVIFAHEKGQDWLLPVIWREYQDRNIMIRMTNYLCLGRPFLSRPVLQGLKLAALASHKMGLTKVTGQAYSGIFNLRYYQGVADQLGSRHLFFTGLAQVKAYQSEQTAVNAALPSSETSVADG